MSIPSAAEYVTEQSEMIKGYGEDSGLMDGLKVTLGAVSDFYKSISSSIQSAFPNLNIDKLTSFIGAQLPSSFQNSFNNVKSGITNSDKAIEDFGNDLLTYFNEQIFGPEAAPEATTEVAQTQSAPTPSKMG